MRENAESMGFAMRNRFVAGCDFGIFFLHDAIAFILLFAYYVIIIIVIVKIAC